MTNSKERSNVNENIDIKDYAFVLVIISVIALISNWTGTGITPVAALPGMAIIFAMIMASLIIAKLVPFYLPVVVWLSVISVLLTIPASPISEVILTYVKDINFLSLLTPVLAYAGLAITKNEVETFKTAGIKIVIIAVLVFTGTYLGSALVADFMLL